MTTTQNRFLFLILLNLFILSISLKQERAFILEITPLPLPSDQKWIGYELPSSSVITQIGWSQKTTNISDYLLGVFEGANSPDFMDALPLYMVINEIDHTEINYTPIKNNHPFKYIRYVKPENCTSSILSNFLVYGYKSLDEEPISVYQPTNIPLIVIQTGGTFFNKTETAECNIVVINNGKIEVNQKGEIRIRGNSSRKLKKKPYQIKFDKKTKILGMPAKAKRWALLSNFMDKTLIRNLVAFKISSILGQKFVPSCQSVDVMINGIYNGNYLICDKVERGKKRVVLDKLEEDEKNEISGGYLIVCERNKDKEKENRLISKKGVPMGIKYPGLVNDKQLKYVQNWFDTVENNVYENNVELIDTESFSQIFILQEFIGNIDAVYGSYYITKQKDDDTMYFGPGWDFDLSLENDGRLYPTNSLEDWVFYYGNNAGTLREFVCKILSNEKILKAIKEKWKDIIISDLTPEILLNYIDEQAKYIDLSQKLNFKKWDILNKRVRWEGKGRGSFQAEIDNLKKYVEERFYVFGKRILSANATSFIPPYEPHPDWNY